MRRWRRDGLPLLVRLALQKCNEFVNHQVSLFLRHPVFTVSLAEQGVEVKSTVHNEEVLLTV
jgi:hypothetical protein